MEINMKKSFMAVSMVFLCITVGNAYTEATFREILSDQALVSLDILDISGHRVMNVFKGVLNPGEQDIATDIDLENGVYFYRLSAEGDTAAGKLVISR